MKWVVDTCIVLDVWLKDEEFHECSCRALNLKRRDGLIIAPPTYIELAPLHRGNIEAHNEDLEKHGIAWHAEWEWDDTVKAFAIYDRICGGIYKPRRVAADALIGAWAMKRGFGLISRDVDFSRMFPWIKIFDPSALKNF